MTALPAAVTVLDSPAISRLAVSTYGDLFRSLPGFNVSNYGQGGIGYGLSLRGYTDAEHGRDIAYTIDGVPLNEVSSLHTPNYADLNMLLPETVKSIEIVRGPFSVEYGDSNMGGSVNITTKQAEPFASVGVSGGTQGTARGIATYSTTQGAWLPYLALEGYHTDGYRDNSFIDRYNSFNKVTTTLPDGATVSFRAQAYGTEYGSPGYASRDAITAGAISERSATNRTDGGNKQLENFVTNYSSGALDQELKGTLFVSHQFSNRFSDFGGGQRVQHEDRTTVGGRVSKVWSGAIGEDIPVQVLLGSNWRTDFIEAFQARTIARAVSAPATVNVGVNQTNVAGFGQVQIKPLDWLKFTAGSRYDQFYYDIDDRITPGGTPNISNGIASPKVGVAITPVKWLELFANYGQGFRSIDVPAELIGNPGIQPFKIVSREGGFQLTFERFRFLASYWTTESSNEAFQADAGLPVTFLGKAQRNGYDVDARWFVVRDPVNHVSLFANYGGVSARLVDAAPSYFVPNVPNYVANVGVDFNVATINAQMLSGSAYITFVGKKNLTQDGLITTSPYSRVTGKLAYTWPEGWTAFTQATWYPGDRLSEIAINFGNPVNASSADIFVSAQPTLAVLAGLTYRFPTVMAAAEPKLVTK
ncbi:TonB-dependent receptor [Bradyrhizobium diversitatis]|uniref:TonB-dependent receptor n=1 Tax=Bradyrhizobium diversitatis TaxID=2755406 RepID=A0ABS0P5M7_9BRAD|nr:TonB-dependent receptor [Bradyrhizobium diversitatis]MBH5388587.1 TonB-dependent receptor [Bradyrhizobium diversitatis]